MGPLRLRYGGAGLHNYSNKLRRMPINIQTCLIFLFMMLFPILLIIGSFYMPDLAQLCFIIYGGSRLHMTNAQRYLKFMFMMLSPTLLVVRTWIILYDRITIGMESPMRYDVFLSFRGPDVRKSFVNHLHNTLKSAGIHVFLDSEIDKGEDIRTTINHAIESCRIRIPIFSPDYANSEWCLNEILLIAQQKQGTTIPLFYKVAPSHVRHPERPESPFSQAFQRYQCRKEIEEWRAALYKVSCLSGWSLDDKNGYEAELVKLVVEEVRKVCKK